MITKLEPHLVPAIQPEECIHWVGRVVWNLERSTEESHATLVCALQSVLWQVLRGSPTAEAGKSTFQAGGTGEGQRGHGPALQRVATHRDVGGDALRDSQGHSLVSLVML